MVRFGFYLLVMFLFSGNLLSQVLSVNVYQVNVSCSNACLRVTLSDSTGTLSGSYIVEWDWKDGHISSQQVTLSGNFVAVTQCHNYSNTWGASAQVNVYTNDTAKTLVSSTNIQLNFNCSFNSNTNSSINYTISSCSTACLLLYYSDSMYNSSVASVSYNWGDGNTITKNLAFNSNGVLFDSSSCHTYSSSGTYHIMIIISVGGNPIDSASVTVTISDTCGAISGIVFEDLNGNCIYDQGEPTINNALISISPGSMTFSQNNGKYSFDFLNTNNTYSVSFVSRHGYSIASGCPSSYNNITLPNSNSYDFALVCVGGSSNDSSLVWLSPPRPGNNAYLTISVCNDSCEALMYNVSVSIPQELSYLYHTINNANNVNFNSNNNNLNFNFLLPGVSCATIHIAFLADTTLIVGDTVCIPYSINNSSDVVCQEVIGSWDPNDKQVFPSGILEPGTPLTYKIRFQNTGNAPAFRVIIKDTLSNKLNPNSLLVIDYSHPMSYALTTTNSGENVLTFRFDNIYLPDSASDPQGSQGYVIFKINPVANLPLGTTVSNKAAIYFDYNPPVITNTVTITYDQTTNILTRDEDIIIYPNPVRDKLIVENITTERNYEIISINGKLIQRGNLIPGKNIISLRNASTGIYILRLASKYYKISVMK